MLLLFVLAADAASPIEQCSVAMRGLGSTPKTVIEQACPAPPKRNLWAGDYDDRCDSALIYARDVAGSARGLPPVMVKGMIAEFDARAARCREPAPPPKPLPPTDCAHSKRLWC